VVAYRCVSNESRALGGFAVGGASNAAQIGRWLRLRLRIRRTHLMFRKRRRDPRMGARVEPFENGDVRIRTCGTGRQLVQQGFSFVLR